jgi:hypothetical protein
MDDVGIFYGHLSYFMAICPFLWPFGKFCVHLVHFMIILYITPSLPFGMFYHEKSGNPANLCTRGSCDDAIVYFPIIDFTPKTNSARVFLRPI